MPSSTPRLLSSGDCVFLEVQRFDRIGKSGRVGMLSAGTVADEFFGMRDTWPAFAARCVQAKHLSAAHAHRGDTLAAFSELIGNSDRHFENISLLSDESGDYAGIARSPDGQMATPQEVMLGRCADWGTAESLGAAVKAGARCSSVSSCLMAWPLASDGPDGLGAPLIPRHHCVVGLRR